LLSTPAELAKQTPLFKSFKKSLREVALRLSNCKVCTAPLKAAATSLHLSCFVLNCLLVHAQMAVLKLLQALTLSEIRAAALLVLAAWVLVPLVKKFCRAVSNSWKLRDLPGPNAGLFGVASVLKVCGVPGGGSVLSTMLAQHHHLLGNRRRPVGKLLGPPFSTY
jgi:hypothetical protein